MSELERRAALRRMKMVATLLLVAAAALFVGMTLIDDGQTWVGYVKGFAEASMVGALADWFAVTALFRHPLGLPIPHTAIIPNRKDQIGRSLGEFVESEFLNAAVISERLGGFGVSRRFGAWLVEEDNAARAGEALGDALRAAMEVLDDDEVQGAMEQLVVKRIRATPISPLFGRAVDIAVEGGHHQRLLDAVLVGLGHFLDDNRTVLRTKLADESPWWVPEPIDDRIFLKINRGIESFLGEVAADPHHPVRQAMDSRIVSFAKRLQADPELLSKGEALKEELLDHPDVRAWLGSLWAELKSTMTAASHDPDSELRRRMNSGVISFGARLGADTALQAKLDDWVKRAVGYVIDNYRHEVADLIAATVERWDGESTSRKIELQVGRDLQFIRINGTLVGGLAGVLIHLIGQVLS
jgi:uncharacterized membrane-anchored protein YjiN (DUF445 family)